MSLDHECPQKQACPLCNPTQEMLWWVRKLLPTLLCKVHDADLSGLSYEEGHTHISRMASDHCSAAGLSGLLAADVSTILTYRLH
jgi:hypothetical protein